MNVDPKDYSMLNPNDYEVRILILSPFKTATTSLLSTFNDTYVIKTHDFDDTFHTNYSHVFLVCRNETDLFVSAFFQDIDNPEFDYYYGDREKVLESDVDDLIDHFNKIDWKKYNHLNVDYYVELIRKYFDVELIRPDVDYNITEKNGTYFIFVRMEKLNHVFEKICIETGLKYDKLTNCNEYQYKWYREKYIEFKEKLNKF